MTEKFSYTDILCYLMPGAYLLTLGIGWWAAIPHQTASSIPLFGEGGVFASVVFVILSFLMGNAIQVVAHSLPELFLRRVFWSGWWPSELALLPKGPCLSETERSAVQNALVKLSLLTAQDVANAPTPTEKWRRWVLKRDAANKAVAEKGQAAFRRGRALLADCSAGTRAVTAEAYYLFFRALSVVSALGAVAFLLLSVKAEWKSWGGLPIEASHVARLPTVLLVILTGLFAWRSRGAAHGFVREVFLSLSVIAESKVLSGNQNNQTT